MKTKKEKPEIQTEESLNWEDNFVEKLEKRNKEKLMSCIERQKGLL